MVRRYKITVIEGDGVGPEIIREALKVLDATGIEYELIKAEAGYNYYRRTGRAFEDDFIDKLKSADAVLKAPLTTPPGSSGYRSINVFIRRELDLYANVRPFKSYPSISLSSFNFTIIRENTEGLYVGFEYTHRDTSFTVRVVSRFGCERIVKFAFNYALKRGFRRVTCVHKANILKESDGLFRSVFWRVAGEYSGLEATEMLVDAAAYNLIRNPGFFNVIVTGNLYGDILSDEAAGLVGSLGLCGSAQIGDEYAVFEPVHGSAPDIAGKGVANPVGEIKALQLMLEYLYEKYGDEKLLKASKAIDEAVHKVLCVERIKTPDLGGCASTSKLGSRIANFVKKLLES